MSVPRSARARASNGGHSASGNPLRSVVLAGLAEAFGEGPGGLEEYREPAGDPGLFGPGSLAWRVHADLTCMLVGGISSLMLQSLHPLAMAGVAQHSSYREDPFGRLRRTARFVAGTTFGASPFVAELVTEVRGVHRRVHGLANDGRAYSAEDPELLTFVHVAEVWSFMRAYQRYSLRPLLAAERDGYLGEVAVVAELLGATAVPRSVPEARAYLRRVRPELRATPDARAAVTFLRGAPAGVSTSHAVAHRLVTEASLDLMPGWARRELGARRLIPAPPVQLATESLGLLLRWAVGPSMVARAASERVLRLEARDALSNKARGERAGS